MPSTPTGPDPAPDGGATDPSVRPWGHYVVLDDGPTAKVKRIVVDPGQRLSLQLHHHRAEHWYVTQGEATVIVGDTEHVLGPGQAVDIPLGTPHRVRSSGDGPLVFIEVQLGDYFGEDDIVRLEDDYGRTG
jgi:mannose-6-phosphate isomerase-like protein (cupin superfamily)